MSRHWQYLRYVLRHKLYVYRACIRLGVPRWRALVHDWTKFLPGQWGPYARYFYGLPKVGDVVEILSWETRGGPARIVETRPGSGRYKVDFLDGSQPRPFWAHDFEVVGLVEALTAFDLAWLDHQRARHHWQAWVLVMDTGSIEPQRMPATYVREMLADWSGAGQAIHGNANPRGWWERMGGEMLLSDATRAAIEKILDEEWPA